MRQEKVSASHVDQIEPFRDETTTMNARNVDQNTTPKARMWYYHKNDYHGPSVTEHHERQHKHMNPLSAGLSRLWTCLSASSSPTTPRATTEAAGVDRFSRDQLEQYARDVNLRMGMSEAEIARLVHPEHVKKAILKSLYPGQIGFID